MEPKTLVMDLAGREFKITNAPIATYASGYAVVSLGDTVIMANATISPNAVDGDFFPLTCDYEENMYAAGKIKGSRFIKREGRPSENAILISRLIDRPIRPLFPKKTRNEVQMICTALSADMEVDPATTALNAASVAMLLSGAPFEGPVGAVRMGYVDEKLVVNPTYKQCEEGKMNLVVAGTIDAITMVEAAMKEVPEEIVLQALEMAHEEIKKICEFQIKYAKQFEIKPIELILAKDNEKAVEAVKSFVATDEAMLDVKGVTKMEVKEKIHAIEEKLFEKYASEIEAGDFSKGELKEVLNTLFEKRMRKTILEKEERLDGRKLDEVRQISIIPDVLPRTHGSAIFQRGETTALTITTLGSPRDSQIVDIMDSDSEKRYMHHYHFPPFAVGEVKRLSGPNRREIGHGDLAERALIPVLPEEKDFPYTIWLVSEIVRCNGSSSMASVCGSTLSLMCAGVPIKKPVAGIAMGLVYNDETGDYKILTDIQGMEDFAGDMDFKVTGTKDGITALQMDIKIKGLKIELMKNAMEKAKVGRDFIMEKMLAVVPEPRKSLSKHAPLIMSLTIPQELIRVVIGKGGETIQGMIKEFEVDIDINDDGIVTVTAPNQEQGDKAMNAIKNLTRVPEAGEVFDGKVTRLMEFGAFVEILPGKEGLVHISEMANERVNRVEDVVKVGDAVKVKLLKIDEQGRYNLSMKALLSGGSTEKYGAHKPAAPRVAPAPVPKVELKEGEKNGTIVPGTQSVRKV
ncbi:MAG: polyribonucleotide nucleotidyltransferase [Candidatus Gracilibacteria bacterium]|nr:polyribonucleotide nucleotidyltransferase [Candidatus Gracilibacteria bacterium]